MPKHLFNILLVLSTTIVINNVLCVENSTQGSVVGNRGLGDLDFLDNKGIFGTKKAFDPNSIMDGKGMSISATSPPAVTVTPTTTLNVTPIQVYKMSLRIHRHKIYTMIHSNKIHWI